MIALVEQSDGTFKEEDRDPICGEDFCDQCGDCLHCYGSDWCPDTEDHKHSWIIYED